VDGAHVASVPDTSTPYSKSPSKKWRAALVKHVHNRFTQLLSCSRSEACDDFGTTCGGGSRESGGKRGGPARSVTVEVEPVPAFIMCVHDPKEDQIISRCVLIGVRGCVRV